MSKVKPQATAQSKSAADVASEAWAICSQCAMVRTLADASAGPCPRCRCTSILPPGVAGRVDPNAPVRCKHGTCPVSSMWLPPAQGIRRDGVHVGAERDDPPSDAVRLNLGSGPNGLHGYVNMDVKFGKPAYPLTAYADESVDEVRASHILEHFSHRDVSTVVREWARVLKPGGILKVAVPNFKAVAGLYLEGRADLPLQGWVMGGQEDADDAHHCLFEPAVLNRLMVDAGLVNIQPWVSEAADCATQEISLNLQGEKPGAAFADWSGISKDVCCVATLPRLMFTEGAISLMHGVQELGIMVDVVQGAFWGHCMQIGLTRHAAEIKYLLTWDYDTVFSKWDVIALWRLMEAHPEVGALAGMQMRREGCMPLFNVVSKDGQVVHEVQMDRMREELYEVATAHFGLTMIRTESLMRVPKPWFQDTPGPDGEWNGAQVDDDIAFWLKWREAGNSVCVAPRVILGHMQLVVTWPGPGMTEVHQPVTQYRVGGRPKAAGIY